MTKLKLGTLSRKQKAFADHLLANPKRPSSEAVMQAYEVKDKNVAKVMAYENLKKPNIQAYLELHADKALKDNLEIAQFSKVYAEAGGSVGSSYAGIAAGINKDILDRTYGKAKQQIEMNSTSLSLTIDLTSALPVTDEQTA